MIQSTVLQHDDGRLLMTSHTIAELTKSDGGFVEQLLLGAKTKRGYESSVVVYQKPIQAVCCDQHAFGYVSQLLGCSDAVHNRVMTALGEPACL